MKPIKVSNTKIDSTNERLHVSARCSREAAKKLIGNNDFGRVIYASLSSLRFNWPPGNLRGLVDISHYFPVWSVELQPITTNCSFFDSQVLQF